MKTWLCLFLLTAAVAFGQADAQQSKIDALAMFPDLGRAGSPFNKAFLEAAESLRQDRVQVRSTAGWPLALSYVIAAELHTSPTAAVSIRELETDIPSFIGKTVLIAGKIDVSDYFNYGYMNAGNACYAFRFRNDSGRADLYAPRAASADLRQQLLAAKEGSCWGIFAIRISERVRHTAGEGVMADLVKVMAVSTGR